MHRASVPLLLILLVATQAFAVGMSTLKEYPVGTHEKADCDAVREANTDVINKDQYEEEMSILDKREDVTPATLKLVQANRNLALTRVKERARSRLYTQSILYQSCVGGRQ